MGKAYSCLGYGNPRGNKDQEALLLGKNFTCKICLEVLDDPVQCQNNEHYYCRKCIAKHLRNSETCPLCMEQLTLETLGPPSRVVDSVVSELKKPRCSHVSRGCKKDVQVEELLLHEQTCGYAPVVCSNEGCKETVNRRDKESHETEECKFRKNFVKGQIFIFGGCYDDEIGKSVEVFNWSTKQWTLVKNCLFFPRWYSFSFLYGKKSKKIMICGGGTERIEYLNPSESGYTSTVTSVSLPTDAVHNAGLLHKDRILTFYEGVVETSFKEPGESRTLLIEKESRSVPAGVHCFGNSIYIVGGKENSMEKYDVVKSKMETLLTLPYEGSKMATVAYKDNIIILGGRYSGKALIDVIMFNVTNHEYKKLPSLLEGRWDCSAVIIGDVIVVMGGLKRNIETDLVNLKTVEYYVIGDSAWQKLPDMNLAREGATACVYE